MADRFEAAVVRFRSDPEMSRFDTTEDVGGCWNTAHRFAWYLHEEGVPYAFRRWRNLPGLRTPFQHNLEVDGRIVCWTHRQIDARAEWPHIEPVESYEARFGEPQPVCATCGLAEHPHCPGLQRDPFSAAVAKLSSDERRQLELGVREFLGGGGIVRPGSVLSRGRAVELRDRLAHPRGPRSLSYAIVAEHGRAFLEFEPISERDLWARTLCFHACFTILHDGWHPDWTYVEGYALSDDPKSNGEPYHHAWLATPAGRVFDPTWGNGGAAYLGVPMALEWVKIERDRRNVEGVFGAGDVRGPDPDAIVDVGVVLPTGVLAT